MPAKRKIKSIAGRETAGIPAKKTRTAQLSADGKDDPATPLKQMVWLPTECWADTFKFLSRRDLLRSVQPACSRFHAIAEKRVDNVHVIWDFTRFIDKLKDKRAMRQLLVDIDGSDAGLAKHFKLARKINLEMNISMLLVRLEVRYLLNYPVQMSVLRNSMELFRGCNLILSLGTRDDSCAPYNLPENAGKNPFVPILSLFQAARPCHIGIGPAEGFFWSAPKRWVRKYMNPCELLVLPTILNCMRLTFAEFDVPTVAKVGQLLEYHLPSAGEDDPNTTTPITERTRIIFARRVGQGFCSKLIERSKKNLLKAKRASDMRAYLVVFQHLNFDAELEPFRLDHPATGEVLQLEQVKPSQIHGPTYIMRRCLAGDLATSDQFYRDTFTPDWNLKMIDEIEPPEVAIF